MTDQNNKNINEQFPKELSDATLENIGGGYTSPSRKGDWSYNFNTGSWEYLDRTTGKVLKTSNERPW